MINISQLPEEVLNAYKQWNVAINCNRSTDTVNRMLNKFNKACEANGLNATDTLKVLNTDVFN